MIGMWADTTGSESARARRRLLFVVNGRSWPNTERFHYTVGDTVRWRVINASADVHPMHLHGFYYRIDGRGTIGADTAYAEATRDMVVTSLLTAGRTMRMTWIPERPGNWLFHCHFPIHFGPKGPLGMIGESHPDEPNHASNHALTGMNGLVVGIMVAPRKGVLESPTSDARRHLRLLVRQNAGAPPEQPYFGFALHETGAEPPPDSGHHAGPPIVLTQGQPVSITVINRSPEPTAIHWHGIELESYFDGVAGFSGNNTMLAPTIAPGDSFEARFTPPRAGTFIYHTHFDELRQQPAGLAGALIVLEPGTRFDPATDIPVLISSPPDPKDEVRAVLLNGDLAPNALEIHAGVPVRLRFINITTGRPGMRMELRNGSELAEWRLIAKDGADLPPGRQSRVRASRPISIGETYDVEVLPDFAGEFRLEARTAGGALLGVIPVRVRP
jgi:FtsP/CotA-like multicopper oxidase with cupredoxin domain